jgi:hypothetical protein
MKLGLILITVILKLQSSWGFSSGAGTSSCSTLTPSHDGNQPQTSEVPVTFNLSTQNLRQGETMTITIEANEFFSFRGFMIQARTLEDDSQVVGSFEFIEGTRNVVCADLPQNSVATHSAATLKNRLELVWRAPTNFVGIINFQ